MKGYRWGRIAGLNPQRQAAASSSRHAAEWLSVTHLREYARTDKHADRGTRPPALELSPGSPLPCFSLAPHSRNPAQPARVIWSPAPCLPRPLLTSLFGSWLLLPSAGFSPFLFHRVCYFLLQRAALSLRRSKRHSGEPPARYPSSTTVRAPTPPAKYPRPAPHRAKHPQSAWTLVFERSRRHLYRCGCRDIS